MLAMILSSRVGPSLVRKSLFRRLCSSHRRFSSDNSTDYIETWQASTVKPTSFYDHHATDKPKKYFYAIDLQGRVFLEETIPKNIATSLKNLPFLNFFFKNLKESTERDLNLLPPEVRQDYPYVSHCGVERNFVRPADAVIVFDSFEYEKTTNAYRLLHHGGHFHQVFDPKSLAISRRSGRLYHKILDHENGSHLLHKQKQQQQQQQLLGTSYGLIKSAIAVKLSENIVPLENEEDGSGIAFLEKDIMHTIPWLPENAEPGSWAMPVMP